MTALKRIINIFAFAGMIAVNVLAETLPINGVTSGQVSDMYASLFTPAGITFSIWAVIYIMLGYFTLWQAIWASDETIERIGMAFVLTCALNAGWLLLWHYKMLYLSTIVILVLLLVLDTMKDVVEKNNWMVRASFSVYLAWITVASIASLFIIAGDAFKNFAFSTIAQVMVWVAAGLVVFMTYLRLRKANDVAYALTMIWALAGIFIKHISGDAFAGRYEHIIIGLLLTIVSIVLLIERKIAQGGMRNVEFL